MAHKSGDFSNSVSNSEASNFAAMMKKLISGRKLIVASNRGALNFSEDSSGKLVARRDTSRSSELFEPLSD